MADLIPEYRFSEVLPFPGEYFCMLYCIVDIFIVTSQNVRAVRTLCMYGIHLLTPCDITL